MRKRHHLRILGLASFLAGLSAVQALPVKACKTVPIVETGFSTPGIVLALKKNPLAPGRLHMVSLTSAHLQLSSSVTLKFDYAAMEHRILKRVEHSVQRKGFRLGLLVRF